MSKADFEIGEFESRQQRVREAMDQADIDLLLVTSPISINYLIGCRAKGYQELQVLFFTLEPDPLTMLTRLSDVAEVAELSLAADVRGYAGLAPQDPMDVVRQIMTEKGFFRRRIGLEVPYYYLGAHDYVKLKNLLGTTLVTEATRLVEDLKLVKSPAELAYIAKAAGFADAGLQTAVETIAEGKTELEVAAEMHRTMMAMGSDAPPSPMNFASGERTCFSHGMPSERRLRPGDFMHFEYGASYRRYCATIGRQFCLGKPTGRMRELYQIVRDACDAAIAEMRDGVPAHRPHEAAQKVIARAGLAEKMVHQTGYGIAPGFPPSWLESIMMLGGSEYTLRAGMVLSVEPPVMIREEKLGARIIDNLLVTETEATILSKFTRDLVCI
jgi:Xaa-Pro aminopeptidase